MQFKPVDTSNFKMNLLRTLLLTPLLLLVPFTGGTLTVAQESPTVSETDSTTKGAPYVPTPHHVARKMLQLGNVTSNDVVYDLGSGDGRIVIMAAKEFGARGVGVEIDSALIQRARRKAREAGVADQVEFRQADLFEVDLRDATVVTLYLWPDMNNRLRPKLRRELSAGDRIVSHSFDIDEWPADTTVSMGKASVAADTKTLFRWTIPDSTSSE